MLRPQSIKPLSISTLHRRNGNYPPSTVHCPPGSLPEGGLIGDVALFMSMSAPNVQQFNIGNSSSLRALADIDIPFTSNSKWILILWLLITEVSIPAKQTLSKKMHTWKSRSAPQSVVNSLKMIINSVVQQSNLLLFVSSVFLFNKPEIDGKLFSNAKCCKLKYSSDN